eukprot:6806887-Pyramimonas_sp.AAC.1
MQVERGWSQRRGCQDSGGSAGWPRSGGSWRNRALPPCSTAPRSLEPPSRSLNRWSTWCAQDRGDTPPFPGASTWLAAQLEPRFHEHPELMAIAGQ